MRAAGGVEPTASSRGLRNGLIEQTFVRQNWSPKVLRRSSFSTAVRRVRSCVLVLDLFLK